MLRELTSAETLNSGMSLITVLIVWRRKRYHFRTVYGPFLKSDYWVVTLLKTEMSGDFGTPNIDYFSVAI